MIRKVTILLFLIFFSLTAQSQYRKFNNPIWTLGTANTIKQNDIHLNLFYISQYGITDKVELRAKPLWAIKYPELELKVKWYQKKAVQSKKFFKKNSFIIATKHGIYYPTPFLKYIQKKNYFNIDFNSAQISPLIVMKNELLISMIQNKNKGCYTATRIYTIKLGNQTSLINKNEDFIVYNNSLTYRLTAALGDKPLWYLGFDFDSKLNYGLNYKLDADFYTVGFNFTKIIFEHKGAAYWYMGKMHRIRPTIGYQLSITNQQAKIKLLPFFDISILLNKANNKDNNQLFDNGILNDAYQGDI